LYKGTGASAGAGASSQEVAELQVRIS